MTTFTLIARRPGMGGTVWWCKAKTAEAACRSFEQAGYHVLRITGGKLTDD